MSIRVYVKREIQKQLGVLESKDGYGNRICEFSYVTLRLDKGEWYFDLDNFNDSIPKAFESFVQEVSYRNTISNSKREFGKYEYKKAEAELYNFGGQCYLYIKSNNISDTKKLYYLIRGGSIRPIISYERKQVARPVGIIKNWIMKLEKSFDSIKNLWSKKFW